MMEFLGVVLKKINFFNIFLIFLFALGYFGYILFLLLLRQGRDSLLSFFARAGFEPIENGFTGLKSPVLRRPAAVAQPVERVLGKDEVMGSNPISS
jgi:hypothetical protein